MGVKLPEETELNNTQKMILKQMMKKDKVAVIGGPGTGKTIVAAIAAIKLAQQGQRILFLSYGKVLKQYIRELTSQNKYYDTNIEISSYHRWLYRLLNKHEYTMDQIEKKLQVERFIYDLDKLEAIIDNNITDYLYDYIFIDEAQDLQDGIVKVFAKLAKKIIITFDDSQKVNEKEIYINDKRTNLLEDLNLEDDFYDLIENYRNTKENEEIAKLFLSSYDYNQLSLSKITSKRSGNKPSIIFCEKIDLCYDWIVNQCKNNKMSTCLIINEKLNQNVFDTIYNKFNDKAKEKFINLIVKWGSINNVYSITNNQLFLLTFFSAKGLEFDNIYIYPRGIDINKVEDRNKMYVSLTRAKNNVTIIIDKNIDSKLIELLKENVHMFEIYEI